MDIRSHTNIRTYITERDVMDHPNLIGALLASGCAGSRLPCMEVTTNVSTRVISANSVDKSKSLLENMKLMGVPLKVKCSGVSVIHWLQFITNLQWKLGVLSPGSAIGHLTINAGETYGEISSNEDNKPGTVKIVLEPTRRQKAPVSGWMIANCPEDVIVRFGLPYSYLNKLPMMDSGDYPIILKKTNEPGFAVEGNTLKEIVANHSHDAPLYDLLNHLKIPVHQTFDDKELLLEYMTLMETLAEVTGKPFRVLGYNSNVRAIDLPVFDATWTGSLQWYVDDNGVTVCNQNASVTEALKSK